MLPGSNFVSGIGDGFKPMGVEAFLPQARIEGLNMGVVRRGSRSGKDQLDIVPLGPLVQRYRSESVSFRPPK